MHVVSPVSRYFALVCASGGGFACARVVFWSDLYTLGAAPTAPMAAAPANSLPMLIGMLVGVPLSTIVAAAIYPRFRYTLVLGVLSNLGFTVGAVVGLQPKVWRWSPMGFIDFASNDQMLIATVAGVLLALLVLPLVRLVRRAPADVPAGLCRGCGYPDRGLTVCPECGKPRSHA